MPINACATCEARIYLDRWGIWRHYESGLMLCVPDEADPSFTGVEVAEPLYSEEYLDSLD